MLCFDPCFATLPADFYTKMPPEAVVQQPRLVHGNRAAAALIGLDSDWFDQADFANWFSGNLALPGGDPLAMVYSGHQFGVWAGQLGDGRALLLGQVRHQNQLWDLQLKGAGKTPYSRMGDGRAVLRSSIREYLGGEAMAGLGIATTRALCLVETNMPVRRERVEPGAVLTRLAQSHIRFGHFEHFFYRNQPDHVRLLAIHVIDNYEADLSGDAACYARWFARVVQKTAVMIADWQAVGFCHGVMNTDNMSILGLTLDSGPVGFLEGFDPGHICNHSDHAGRYAYDQQPSIGLWNLHALAHALQPVLPWAESTAILADYHKILMKHYRGRMRQKLGFAVDDETVDDLWESLIWLMVLQRADYTNVFRHLNRSDDWLGLFRDAEPARQWLDTYYARSPVMEIVKATNPKYVLRNWVAEKVIRAAEDDGDYRPLQQVFTLLQTPFDDHPGHEDWAQPAPAAYRDLAVSCSS